MDRIILSSETKDLLDKRYNRVSQNVCFGMMLNTTLLGVGTGAFSYAIEQFNRLAIKSIHLFDNKLVQRKNLVAQDFDNSDEGTPKPIALQKRLKQCEFEKGNPDVPPLQVATHGDFLSVTDNEIEDIIFKEKADGKTVILVMASDYHPAQARGNRIALKYDIAVFWVGIYTMGKAGEIIFYVPGYDLPCYRCITESRYRFFDKNRLSGHLRGDNTGAGISAGLPQAASFIDAVLLHLIIGYIHRGIETNQHGKLFRRLLAEKRNFIQCQLDPDYMLNDTENIFSQIQGPDLITFNTIFQQEHRKADCLDCSPIAAKSVWKNTDYTRENYLERLKCFSNLEPSLFHADQHQHPLIEEYENYFPVWEELLNLKLVAEGRFEIIIDRNNQEFYKMIITPRQVRKTIRNVEPGSYSIRSSANSLLWQGDLRKHELLWTEAFPEDSLKLAADTEQIVLHSTKEIKLLNGKIIIRVFPEIESGRLELEINSNNAS